MTELNDKLITYGNLSTFYDKLQEQGLGGNAIEDASVLPDASENKDKLFRLDNGDKDVYAAKLLSSETITTNRLPDEQQIDKAYLYDTDNFVYYGALYYKGTYKIVCSDGELDGYGWLSQPNDDDYYEFYLTTDNAENISSGSTAVYYSNEDYEGEIDTINKVITTEFSTSDIKINTASLSVKNIIPIPAIYNAPESAQIGNAYIIDGDNIENSYYDGAYTTVIVNGTTYSGYKWVIPNSTYYLLTKNKASEIYFSKVWNEIDELYYYYCDNVLYLFDTDEVDFVSTPMIQGMYIPQLNAPDSEQVGNATRILTTTSGLFYRGDTLYTLIDDYNHSYTGYKWSNDDETNFEFSLKKASEMYGDSDTYVVDNYVDFWEYLGNNTYHRTDEEPFGAPYEVEIRNFNIVKYQRTETTEEWGWQDIIPTYASDSDIDSANTISCTVKPIADVSALPDAEANKDSVLRLESDKKLYVAKYNPQIAPDSQQIGVAYLEDDGNEKLFYQGTEVTIVAQNGTFTGYIWLREGQTYNHVFSSWQISVVKANEILDNTALLYYSNDDLNYVSGTTFNCPVNLETKTLSFYLSEADIIDYHIKTNNYQWQRVVTEDELDGIGDVFQALETRIYALEHPTTTE